MRHTSSAIRTIGHQLWLVGLFLAATVLGAKAEPIADRFAQHTAGSQRAIDHSAWDNLLRQHLQTGKDGVARLDYPRLVGDQHKRLKSYIAALASEDVGSLDRPEQAAYWINLYNAVTLDAVLGRYPVATINDVDIKLPDGSSGGGPWKAKLVKVGGVDLSLDDIENRIVRPVFKDARAHYLLNCLSVGCPNMRSVALTGANLEGQLDAAASEYVNDPRGITFAGGKVVASSIYDWFADDFGGFAGILAHMRRYAATSLKARLASVNAFDAYDYDWALADASVKR